MSVKRGRELELDFIRVISMFMIIFCHISAEAGMKWGEYFNVGVMILNHYLQTGGSDHIG